MTKRNTSEEIESLAPNAGTGIGKFVASELLSRPEIVKKIADSLERGLTAGRRVWDKSAIAANGTQGDWVFEPDTTNQLKAVFGIFSHFEGEPLKRIMHEIKRSGVNIEEAGNSPDVIEAMQRELDALKAKQVPRIGAGLAAAKRVKPAAKVVEVE
jgi:hypothetical protein